MLEDLTARWAHPSDLSQFVQLSRRYAQEQGLGARFDQGTAIYTFGGLSRCDPAIIVLVHGEKIVGFATARLASMPFSKGTRFIQEDLYTLPDYRCEETADLLLFALHDALVSSEPEEIRLWATPYSHKHLLNQDYGPVASLFCWTRKPKTHASLSGVVIPFRRKEEL